MTKIQFANLAIVAFAGLDIYLTTILLQRHHQPRQTLQEQAKAPEQTVDYGVNPFQAPPATTSTAPSNDVTASLLLLLKTQEITSEVFSCPTTQPEKWDFGAGSDTAQLWSNWNNVSKNLSYSYENPWPTSATQPIPQTQP